VLGYYNYTVILTYMSVVSAIFGIVLAAGGDTRSALICLMVCGLCDTFDGTVARTCKTRSEEAKAFGMHIDSLSDLVAFGVLPASIGYSLGLNRLPGMLVMAAYVLAALIRLAYFDVQEAFLQGKGEKREYYLGLPVTLSCVFVPALLLLAAWLRLPMATACGAILVLHAFAFLLKFKLKKIYMPRLLIPAVLGAAVFVLLLVYGGRIV